MPSNGHDMDLRPSKGIDLTRVIGVPHLVGRMFDLYDGLLVVPNGESWEASRLTLLPDGSLVGPHVRHEGRWAPYGYASEEYAPSLTPRAFALMYPDAVNGPYATTDASPPLPDLASPSPSGGVPSIVGYSGIPDSVWRHTRADMPVGYLCGDPESPSQVCLIPDVPLASSVRLVYLVASCDRFYRQTVPAVLDQLGREGIEPERIKVVVNGCASTTTGTISGTATGMRVSAAFSTHDAWEWSALYEAPLRWPHEFDYAMLIHDTVTIQPGFRQAVERMNGHLPWDHLPASPMARCLLGLYAYRFLERVNPWLRSIHRISKADGIMAEVAGELLARASTSMAMGPPAEWKGIEYPYGTTIPRLRKEFRGCRVDKFLHAAGSPTRL